MHTGLIISLANLTSLCQIISIPIIKRLSPRDYKRLRLHFTADKPRKHYYLLDLNLTTLFYQQKSPICSDTFIPIHFNRRNIYRRMSNKQPSINFRCTYKIEKAVHCQERIYWSPCNVEACICYSAINARSEQTNLVKNTHE